MILGLLVGDPALAAQLLDQRVVGGQHPQLAVTPHIRAAVADVGDRDVVAVDEQRRSASSPCPSGVESCWASAWMRPFASSIDRGAERPPAASPERRSAASNRLGGDPRGNLARLGASHAVGDREQRRAGEVGVLVRGPLAPGVRPEGLLADAQRHQCSPGSWSSKRNSVSPILIWSRSESSASPWSLPPFRIGAVGRAHVLDVVGGPARVEPGVDRGGEAVLDPHVGVARAARSRARRRGRSARSAGSPPPVTATSQASVAGARPPAPTGWKPVASGAGAPVLRSSRRALRETQNRNR